MRTLFDLEVEVPDKMNKYIQDQGAPYQCSFLMVHCKSESVVCFHNCKLKYSKYG